MQTVMTSDLLRVFNPLRLAGPIFDKELRVASRRGRTYLLRFGYIGVLSLFVLSAWRTEVGIHAATASSVVRASQMGSAGLVIVGGITWVQFLMTQLLAIVLLSGTVGDEIRKRSLDALLVSPVSSLQIILGKLFSQLLQLVLLLAVSLPLLAVVRVFGGVPWNFVLSGLCITLTAALVTGSLSLFLSMADRNTQTVIAGTIGWCAVVWLMIPWVFSLLQQAGYIRSSIGRTMLYSINPFQVLGHESAALAMPTLGPIRVLCRWPVHCLVMLFITAVILALSVRRVRRAALAPVVGAREGAAKPTAFGRLSRRSIRRIKGSPVAWREMKRPIFPRGRRGLMQAILLAIAIAAAVGALTFLSVNMQGNLAGVCIVCAFVLALVFGFNVTSSAAAAIAREKEGRTLPILLMTPYEDGKIVKDKAIGILRRNGPLLIPIPVLGLLACASAPSLPPSRDVLAGVLWFSLSLVGHTALLMGLGFCLSAYLKTTAAAIALTYAIFFGVKLFGFMFFVPIAAAFTPIMRGSPLVGLVVYAGVQATIYAGIGWVLGCTACAALRPNCQR